MAVVKTVRRAMRPAGKTLQAIARWRRFSFHEAPPIFGNSKPKSGSHLLLQILNGFTRVMPYIYVQADPVRTVSLLRVGRRSERDQHARTGPARKKIRIGYFSADFRNHPVSILMAELFELHDRSRFELFGFSFGPDDHSELRKRVIRSFKKVL